MSRIKGFETIARRGAFSVVKKLFIRRIVFAFTLAEVLIVLGIIGLVADMTIPTLHQNITEKVTTTRLKKTYLTLESAYRRAIAEDGPPIDWETPENAYPSSTFLKKLKPYLNVSKFCEPSEEGCFATGYRHLNGTKYIQLYATDLAKLQLADGTTIVSYPDDDHNGWFGVDINGFNPPNQWGYDFFAFRMMENSLRPFGSATTGANGIEDFESSCKISKTGYGCTAWVLYNGNMDYLHCDDLSWAGKKKCG